LRAGIEEAQEECERMLMKLLGCSRSGIYLEAHELTASGVREQFLKLIEKRLQRIPLAYLLQEADFWQETLYVDERCLIPRPETEILVEQILKAVGKSAEKRFSFLDIGTGSGAISVAILRTFKNAAGTLLDISAEALEVAEINLEKHGIGMQVIARNPAGAPRQSFKNEIASLPLADRNDNKAGKRARLVQGDLFEPFSREEKWDLIVSNPPYLAEDDWKGIQEELRFEPKGALDGGKDGLDFYRKIVRRAKDHLVSGGLLALEVGQGQADKVSKWLQTAGYDHIQRFKDHLGIERVIIARSGN
jgi:release factor glutamine methyltransferase